jgi:DHA1 family multidrug resistance protein-like MFS transporter
LQKLVRSLASWQKNLYLTWFVQLLSTLGFNFCLPFLPYFVVELGVVDEGAATMWAAVLTAAPSLLLIIFSPLWGAIADRYGRKPMVSRTLIAGFTAIFLMSRVQTVEQLLILRLIQGAFSGTIAACMAMVSTMVPERHLGSSLGLMQTAVFCGTSFGPLFGGIAADVMGFRNSFFLASLMLLAGILIIIFLVHEDFKPAVKEKGKRKDRWQDLHRLLTSRTLLAMSFILFATQFSLKAMLPITPLVVGKLVTTDMYLSTYSGLVISVTGLTAAVAATCIGKIGDQKGHQHVLLICAIGTGVMFLGHMVVGNIITFLLVRGLVGLVLGGILPAANAIIGASVGQEIRGQAYGVSSSASYFGNFAGPIVAGIFASNLGFQSVFILVAFLFLFSAFLIKVSLPSGAMPAVLIEVVDKPKDANV